MPARLLIVDDEPAIARTIARLLRQYELAVETDSLAAHARLAAGEHFDGLVTDYNMPNLKGDQLCHFVLASRPTVRVGMISGSPPDDLDPRITLLLKPFGNAALLQFIRELVGG